MATFIGYKRSLQIATIATVCFLIYQPFSYATNPHASGCVRNCDVTKGQRETYCVNHSTEMPACDSAMQKTDYDTCIKNCTPTPKQ